MRFIVYFYWEGATRQADEVPGMSLRLRSSLLFFSLSHVSGFFVVFLSFFLFFSRFSLPFHRLFKTCLRSRILNVPQTCCARALSSWWGQVAFSPLSQSKQTEEENNRVKTREGGACLESLSAADNTGTHNPRVTG